MIHASAAVAARAAASTAAAREAYESGFRDTYDGNGRLTDVLAETWDGSVAGEPTPGTAALALTVGPSPAGASATVRFTLGAPAHVRLVVTDLLGREVARLVDSLRPAGDHAAALGVAGFAPGVYVVRIDSGSAAAVQHLTVIR